MNGELPSVAAQKDLWENLQKWIETQEAINKEFAQLILRVDEELRKMDRRVRAIELQTRRYR